VIAGNRLAALVSIAGVSLPLQFKGEFVAACQFPLSINSRRHIAAKNQRINFQQGIFENF
jgi:hypothetical protein